MNATGMRSFYNAVHIWQEVCIDKVERSANLESKSRVSIDCNNMTRPDVASETRDPWDGQFVAAMKHCLMLSGKADVARVIKQTRGGKHENPWSAPLYQGSIQYESQPQLPAAPRISPNPSLVKQYRPAQWRAP
jgi:hypothetical protein